MSDDYVYLAVPLAPERAEHFEKVFGEPMVEVTDIIPEVALVLGIPTLVFWVKLEALSPEVTERLIADLAERFELTIEEARRDLPMGVPIVAEDIVVGRVIPWPSVHEEVLSGRQN